MVPVWFSQGCSQFLWSYQCWAAQSLCSFLSCGSSCKDLLPEWRALLCVWKSHWRDTKQFWQCWSWKVVTLTMNLLHPSCSGAPPCSAQRCGFLYAPKQNCLGLGRTKQEHYSLKNDSSGRGGWKWDKFIPLLGKQWRWFLKLLENITRGHGGWLKSQMMVKKPNEG